MLSTHILVADANDLVSSSSQNTYSRTIVSPLVLGGVYCALKLDHNALAKTAEINDEAVKHVLSPKL